MWEHAYYLKYGPKRAAFLEAWWRVVDWQQVRGWVFEDGGRGAEWRGLQECGE